EPLESCVKVSERFRIRPPPLSPLRGQERVIDSLAVVMAPAEMVRQTLEDLVRPFRVEPLQRTPDSGVKQFALSRQEAVRRHHLGERVLERMLRVREQLRFIQESRSLQVAQAAAQILVGEAGDRLEEHFRYI